MYLTEEILTQTSKQHYCTTNMIKSLQVYLAVKSSAFTKQPLLHPEQTKERLKQDSYQTNNDNGC